MAAQKCTNSCADACAVASKDAVEMANGRRRERLEMRHERAGTTLLCRSVGRLGHFLCCFGMAAHSERGATDSVDDIALSPPVHVCHMILRPCTALYAHLAAAPSPPPAIQLPRLAGGHLKRGGAPEASHA